VAFCPAAVSRISCIRSLRSPMVIAPIGIESSNPIIVLSYLRIVTSLSGGKHSCWSSDFWTGDTTSTVRIVLAK